MTDTVRSELAIDALAEIGDIKILVCSVTCIYRSQYVSLQIVIAYQTRLRGVGPFNKKLDPVLGFECATLLDWQIYVIFPEERLYNVLEEIGLGYDGILLLDPQSETLWQDRLGHK